MESPRSASAVSVNDTMCARKFCRPRRPIVARGRADWLSERGLFRIRFRNASLLLMLRLANYSLVFLVQCSRNIQNI